MKILFKYLSSFQVCNVVCAPDIVLPFMLLQAACKNEPESTDAKRAVELLYDTALISSGFTVSTKDFCGTPSYSYHVFEAAFLQVLSFLSVISSH